MLWCRSWQLIQLVMERYNGHIVWWFGFQRKINSNHLPNTQHSFGSTETMWYVKYKMKIFHLEMKKRNHLEVKRRITLSTQSIFYRCCPMWIDSNVYVSIHWEIKYKLLENVRKIYIFLQFAWRSTNGAKHRKTGIHQLAPNYYITMGREPNQTVII